MPFRLPSRGRARRFAREATHSCYGLASPFAAT